MGMFDEVYCHAELPDGRDPRGTCFQTKSFPDPCMCRYRITSAGRLIDSANNDLEPDGYLTFYTVDRDGENKSPGKIPGLREYRARFLSGQLQNIVRVNEDNADRIRYSNLVSPQSGFNWPMPEVSISRYRGFHLAGK
jgi:hypothetical protein